MALIIQKFGGTSVGTLARIAHVADIVAETRAEGHEVVVVVSAMSGETDRLIQMANQLGDHKPASREYDALVSTGECVSAALLSIALNQKGIQAHSLTGRQAEIFTSNAHRRAQITRISDKVIRGLLAEKTVPIVTGFQGVNASGDVTTLERGGSDTTAVALAAFLNADECQIYTDVAGVYTSDPRVIPKARLIEKITYTEMLALASLGAKVLHRQAVEFAKKHRIPVRILSSFEKGNGTLVAGIDITEKPIVSGIAFDRKQIKLSLLGIPKKINIVEAFQKANFDMDMNVHNHATSEDTSDFIFTVHVDDYEKARDFCMAFQKESAARDILVDDKIAKLSLVGLGMDAHASVARKIFETLGAQNIPIHLITSSNAKVSTIIPADHLEVSAQALHDAFSLE